MTRVRVLEAAADVFAEKGFRVATISDVADRAGYTIGAVYSNFVSKDALFRALMSDRLARVEAGLAEAFGDVSTDHRHAIRSDLAARLQGGARPDGGRRGCRPVQWWRLLNDYRAYVADDQEAKRRAGGARPAMS